MTILITGASGVVGRAVAEELQDHRLIGLVHADGDPPPVDEALVSDLAEPRLGLDERRWRELAREVDAIVHSGALTEWGQAWPRYEAINIGGTRTVAELAHDAGAPVHLISTAFVRAIENDALDRLNSQNVVTPYITSKLESERLLAASGVPHTIVRPTNLVGHSRTGASRRPQIVQQLCAWVARGRAPYIPMHPGNVIDVATLDVCAMAIARAVEAEDVGRLHWVTYGDRAMSVRESMEVVAEHARARGREIEVPPIVDPRLPLPVPLDRVPPTSRRFLKVLIDVSEVTHASGGVLPTSMPELGERLGVPMPSDRDALRLTLDYWSAEKGRAPTAA